LDQLPPGDPLLVVRLPSGLVGETSDQAVCPWVALPATTAGLEAVVPHRLVPRVLRSLRRLDRETNARFRLHAAEWHARGTAGVLADSVLQSFHRDVAAGMLAAGRLRLHGLRID